MQGQKSKPRNLTGGGWFNREFKLLGLFLWLISLLNIILSSDTFALFVPTLSASIDQANLQVNGNQVINSTDKTTEIPFNFTVNTNNRTGYTATLSAETENTALINASSVSGAKIDSINMNLTLNNLPNNTWGYKFGGSSNYSPIPVLSTPAQILQTTGKTNGNESNQLSIGMKLADNLESGNYTNKLILSFISNPYQMRAVMANGQDFNTRVGGLDQNQTFEHGIGKKDNIKHIKYSLSAPTPADNAISVEDTDSDYEIKAWFSPADNTLYYNTSAQKIFLNPNSANMFLYFTGVIDIDLSHLDSSDVTDMHSMFFNMKALKELDLSHFDTRKNTNLASYFGGDVSLQRINLTNFNTENVTDMRVMFYGLSSLQTLDVSSFNTKKVTMMDSMFYGLSSIRKLDLSNFDTSQVVSIPTMFSGDVILDDLNISSFNTSKVENMSRMFGDCKSLTTLNLSHFNTENVNNMASMFNGMAGLTTLNIDNFNTKNVTNMAHMFGGMNAIENLSLTSFDTSNVTIMNGMFSSMPNLKTLDISTFNTQNVSDMGYIFAINNYESDNLTTIYASDNFVTDNVMNSQGIFNYRKKLRGGSGSYLVNPNTADKSWLRIDDSTNGRPGYFTRKP